MPRSLPRCPPGFTDHIFTTAHGVNLPLRVWPPARGKSPLAADLTASGGVPWLLWVHGGMLSGLAGGYTCGKWTTPTAWVSRAFNDRGYAVASVGYRLQPHASLADMVGDTVAAAHWCRANLPSLVGADPDGWAVGGASSGATLAGMAAHIVQPPPKAFLNVYGLVDVANYRSEEAGRDAADWPYLVASEDELAQYVADGLAHPHLAQVQNPWAEEMPPHVSLDEARHNLGLPDFTPTRDHLRRVDLYTYVAKHRNLIDIICRRDQYKDDEAGYRLHMENLSPHHVLHYKDTFPPTWFMHGTSDNIIPADQSRRMADKLKEMGVATGEHWEEGAGHVYDFAFETPDDAGWKENVEPAMDFIDSCVKGNR